MHVRWGIPMNREPNALDAIAYVGMRIAEIGAYFLIGFAIFVFWVIT